MLRIIILLWITIQLSGCFIAPGMKMQTPTVTRETVRAATEIQPYFIPVNAALIEAFKQQNMLCFHDCAYHYLIGPHDILNIYVWGHPEFSSPVGQAGSEQGINSSLNTFLAPSGFLVGPEGSIFFPIVGYVHVAGMTVEQIRTEITQLLCRYVRHPQVDVRVIGFRSKKVYVMGEVYKPGIQPITDSPMSITDAINLAGGMDPNFADPGHIFVIRFGCGYVRPYVFWLNAKSPTGLLLGENFYLQPHDVVFVSTAGVANWNRAISQILPTIQTAWMTYSMISQFNK